jgi:hypothetical protein
MTNQDVIDMVSLGFSDGVIIEKLRTVNVTDFDTSLPGLKVLKAAKVSDAVIRIMINPALASPNTPGAAKTRSLATDESLNPSEAGVYIEDNNRSTEMPPEIVNWKTGGALKSTATLGIVRGDKNGTVMKAKSPTQLAPPLEFIIRTLEGTSVEEYQLLRLRRKNNRREFRSVTGGVLHVSGGAQRDDIGFQSEKIGTRTWRVSLKDLPNGEYGFLPPGVASVSISASGKMYTFGVVDGQSTRALWEASRKQQPGETAMSPSETSPSVVQGTIGASSSGNPTIRHDGITLSNVVSGGPAEEAGIRTGDVILAIDDRYLFTAQEMNQEIRRHSPGTKINIRYHRYSIIYEVPLVMGFVQ